LPITVAILGGDPLVGRTLEVVLGGAGYEARFLNGAFVDDPVELPEEVRLVILGSGLHPEGREGFLSAVQGAPAAAKMPGFWNWSWHPTESVPSDRAPCVGRAG
jgi:hypothetical protein